MSNCMARLRSGKLAKTQASILCCEHNIIDVLLEKIAGFYLENIIWKRLPFFYLHSEAF